MPNTLILHKNGKTIQEIHPLSAYLATIAKYINNQLIWHLPLTNMLIVLLLLLLLLLLLIANEHHHWYLPSCRFDHRVCSSGNSGSNGSSSSSSRAAGRSTSRASVIFAIDDEFWQEWSDGHYDDSKLNILTSFWYSSSVDLRNVVIFSSAVTRSIVRFWTWNDKISSIFALGMRGSYNQRFARSWW